MQSKPIIAGDQIGDQISTVFHENHVFFRLNIGVSFQDRYRDKKMNVEISGSNSQFFLQNIFSLQNSLPLNVTTAKKSQLQKSHNCKKSSTFIYSCCFMYFCDIFSKQDSEKAGNSIGVVGTRLATRSFDEQNVLV